MASTTRPAGTPGVQSADVFATQKDVIVRITATNRPTVQARELDQVLCSADEMFGRVWIRAPAHDVGSILFGIAASGVKARRRLPFASRLGALSVDDGPLTERAFCRGRPCALRLQTTSKSNGSCVI